MLQGKACKKNVSLIAATVQWRDGRAVACDVLLGCTAVLEQGRAAAGMVQAAAGDVAFQGGASPGRVPVNSSCPDESLPEQHTGCRRRAAHRGTRQPRGCPSGGARDAFAQRLAGVVLRGLPGRDQRLGVNGPRRGILA